MPLARIVTRTPAQLAALSEYLRARGYTVELVEPGTLRTTSAELEMELEGCTAEEAMSRGVRAAEAAQVGNERRAIAYDITGRPVAFADDEEPPAKGGNAMARAWTGLREASRAILEDLRLSFGRLREWAQEGRQTVQQYRTHYQEEHSRMQAEKEREREAQALAREAERSRRQEEDEARHRAAAERFRREQELAAQRAAEDGARREQEEAARHAELAAARDRMRQQQEQARREELAEQERRLVERFRRAARQDAVQERFEVEQSTAQQQVAPAEAEVLARREEPSLPPRGYRRDNDWKKAAVAAVVIALLATFGYAAYENRQPAAPLSNRALVRSQSVSQPVPFGAAVVPPPQLTTTAPPPQRPVPQSDIAPAAAAPKPSPRIRRTRRTRVADDTVAEDEVVVHHSAPTSTRPRTTTANNGPKHISDLEQ